MKGKILRGVLLWCLLMGAVSCTKDNVGNVSPQYSELLTALQSTGAFYEFAENPDTAMVNMRDKMPYKEQWSMLFNQALDHNNEGGEKFKQQVCILFRGFDRPTIYITEGYMSRGLKFQDKEHQIELLISENCHLSFMTLCKDSLSFSCLFQKN